MTEHAEAPRAIEHEEPAGQAPVRPHPRALLGPFSARQLAVANAIVFGSALLLFLVTRPLGGSSSTPVAGDPGAAFYQLSAATQGLAVGQRAPDLSGVSNGTTVQLADLDGKPMSLAALKGRPVWINFWATWCPPCIRETPVLRDTYKAHQAEGLVLLAIDVQEPVDAVRAYAQKYGLTYTIGLDVTGAIFRTYQVYGLPTQSLIDREGVIRGRYFGPMTPDLAQEQLKAILGP